MDMIRIPTAADLGAQVTSQKDAASGYAGLDAGGLISLNPMLYAGVGARQRRMPKVVWCDPCTTLWTADGNCSIASETTNAITSSYAAGAVTRAATAITKTATNANWVRFRKDFAGGSELDASDTMVRLRFRFSSALSTSANYIRLTFCSSTGGANAEYAYLYFKATPTATNVWHDVWQDVGGATVGAGTVNWDAITRIEARFYTTNNADVPTVIFDSLTLYERRPKGIICLTMDDGNDYQLAAMGYASSKMIPVSTYVVSSLVGNAGKLTWDQLRALDRDGHCVCNHSHSHTAYDWETVAAATVISDMALCAKYLVDNGLPAGARCWCPPGGNFSAATEYAGQFSAVCDNIRVGTSSGGSLPPPGGRFYYTQVFNELASAGDLTAAKAVVDVAISIKALAMIGTHLVPGGATNIANFAELVDYVAAARDADTLTVATMADLPFID